MRKIVFFVQTRKAIGGSQIQFLDFAAYITKHFGYETYYINHPHPLVEEQYKDSGIIFLDVDNCDYSQFEDAVFFTPINYLFYLLVKIEKLRNAKIYLYIYHPEVLTWLLVQFYDWRKDNDQLEKLFRLLLNTKAYCFMDLSNYLSMKRRIDLPWEERYIPVTIHNEIKDLIDETQSTRIIDDDEPLQIGWMGRLDNDKIYSILNAADNLIGIQNGRKVDFHLIGDGNAKAKLSITKYSPQIRFIFNSYLYGEERDAYIKNNIDVMIAMGISAIDSAMLEIPTVIPIISPKAFWSNMFVYIQDIKKYSLGWNIQDAEKIGCVTHTIQDIVETVYNGKKEQIGREGRKFCIDSFSLASASNMLVKQLEETELTVEKCLEIPIVKKQLNDYKLYKKIRPMRDYSNFHEFVVRTNRFKEKNTKEKVKFVISKLKKIKR